MRSIARIIWLSLTVFVIGASAVAAQETEAEAAGLIHAIAPDGSSVNLTHDPIPNVGWPAMTMDLGLSERASLDGIDVGSVVIFTLERGPDGIYRIGTITPAPDGTEVEAAPAGDGMDHDNMDHGSMDHGSMDHGSMDHDGHAHHNMTLDAEGMVMNANADTPPDDCAEISGDHEFTIRVGRKHAGPERGSIFGYDQNEFEVEPCARVTVTLINEDQVRHMWMLHGLPRYLYPQGMFHLEVAGGATKSGTFIVPSNAKTYLIHCDIPQHMEKGLKGQLLVAGGDGDLPSIAGVSGPVVADRHREDQPRWHGWIYAAVGLVGLAGGVFAFKRIG